MTQYETTDLGNETIEASSRWTTQQMKLAGVGGMVGGIGVLAAALLGSHAALSTEGSLAFALWSLVTAGLFTLVFGVLIGVHARYSPAYGRLGRIAMSLFGLTVAGVVASMAAAAILSQSSIVYSVLWSLGDVAFMAMFPIATVVGLVLWRRTDVNRLAAGLLAACVPLLVGGFALVAADLIPESLAFVPIATAFGVGIAALGYDLWTNGTTTEDPTRASPDGM